MDEILKSIAGQLLMFMLVAFLITETAKRILLAWLPDSMGPLVARRAQTVALVVGIILALGWKLSILPKAETDKYQAVAQILTGLIIGAGAVGWFEVLKTYLPWLKGESKEPADPDGDG